MDQAPIDIIHTQQSLDSGKGIGIQRKPGSVMTSFHGALLRTWSQICSFFFMIYTTSISHLSERFGMTKGLEQMVSHDRQSLDTHLPQHGDRPDSPGIVSRAISHRSLHTGHKGDSTDITIITLRESLSLCPPGHLGRSAALFNLASGFQKIFEQTNGMEDLEEAIVYHRQSLDIRPPGHPDRPSSLSDLGAAIHTRFQRLEKAEDLEEAIVYLRQSLDLRPPDHPDRYISLTSLANALQSRFDKSGEMKDLEAAIAYHRQSFNLRPLDDPDLPAVFSYIASAIHSRFQQTGKSEDLEEAILCLRQSLDLRPPGHPNRSVSLNGLAIALRTRFQQTGKMGDLEEAIVYLRQSLDIRPPGHPDRFRSLTSLANALQSRFDKTGEMEDLEAAIVYYRQSFDLQPPGNPNRSAAFSNIAGALHSRFRQTGKPEDLEEAILHHRQSLDLRPPGHPNRSDSLNNLANVIRTSYARTGKLEDLEEAIFYHRQSLDLRAPGHPSRPSSLNGLAIAIHARFGKTGEMENLEEAITHYLQLLELHPPDHPNRSIFLINLANAIHTRFRHMGKMEDLEQAIVYLRQSLYLYPPRHANRSKCLNNLANAIHTRFKQTGKLDDLEEAIAYLRQSLDLHPPGHPNRSALLGNLANAIQARFQRMGGTEDLEEAIVYFRQSLDLRPPGHPDRFKSLANLAGAIHTRFKRMGKKEDLEDAIRHLHDADTNIPTNHPLRTEIWAGLASVHLTQYSISPTSQELTKAFTYFEHSANHPTASIKSRFEYAQKWATTAGRYRHESTVRAYSMSLTLLDRYLVVTPSVESQQKFLASTTTVPKSLASDAASSAIEAGQPDIAVELLDRGRAIIFSNMRKHRHPLEKLRAVDPGLADEFETLSVQLERNAMSSESEWTGDRPSFRLEVQQQKHRVLSENWREVVERIRKVDGFTNFLQAVPFATLRKAASEGPVIIVNINFHRSDAIIVRDTEPPVVVPLPDALPDDLTPLSSKFSNPRVSSKQGFSNDLRPILQTLWRIIVGPVTEQLAVLGVVGGTRIWWCPTSDSCALPLHAAGPYLPGQKCLPDLYISSYTSTLSTLIAARSGMVPRTTAPNLLVIASTGQPDAPIPDVEKELHRIQQLGDFVNVLVGKAASRENVISGLQQHSWAHFACHGHRNPEPFHSSFQLDAGEHLELLELIKAKLPDAEHAFLSACHAAAADIQGTPDEVLHLAGALQFCGFRSVVGTMWAMADIDGPDVAGDFYKYMFRDPGRVDFRDSAKALNRATREMRKRTGMTLGRWVNFIHIGA